VLFALCFRSLLFGLPSPGALLLTEARRLSKSSTSMTVRPGKPASVAKELAAGAGLGAGAAAAPPASSSARCLETRAAPRGPANSSSSRTGALR